MCGVFGYLGPHRVDPRTPYLESSFLALEHRGPDSHGAVEKDLRPGWSVVGNTRLAIIDLSSAGNQPIVSSDGRYVLVFNGEIFNYKEIADDLKSLGIEPKSTCDSEVLLNSWIQWGEAALNRLVGMFAFAVLDTREKRLTCVRDAFGIKPFFWTTHNEVFWFASEIQALIEASGLSPLPSLNVAATYLFDGIYDRSRATFVDGVWRLQAGHLLEVTLINDRVDVVERRWWEPQTKETFVGDFAGAARRIRESFLESLEIHLRSDVPVGVALSGGIDSTILASSWRYLRPTDSITAFSFLDSDSALSEAKWIDLVGEQIGARLVFTEASQANFDADMDLLVAAQGEPFVGPTVYAQFCVARRAAAEGVKVLLEGQGADELFGGYDGYPYDVLSSFWSSRNALGAARFFWGWGQFPGRSRVQLTKGLFSSELRKRGYRRRVTDLIKDGFDLDESKDSALLHSVADDKGVRNGSEGRFLARALGCDLSAGGLEALLRHGDRNSMAWSIENRVPFLTTSMADICLSVPENFLVSTGGLTKRLLREAFRGIAPDAVLDRTDKIGFGTSLTPTFVHGESFRSNELDALETLPFLDMNSVVASYRTSDSSRVKQFSASQRWRFYNYAKWAQLMLVTPPFR